nr:copia protein [Tanacetum cinerariifolium]
MKDKFQMSSMGELTFFLGLQVKQKKDEIFISQDKYVAEILKKFGLSEGKSASTPIDAEKPLLKDSDVVATSSTEAEYVAAASGCAQVLWMQNHLLDYGNVVIEIDVLNILSDALPITTNGIQLTMSNPPERGVNTPRSDEDRLKLMELMVFLLQKGVYGEIRITAARLSSYCCQANSDAAEGFAQIIDFLSGSYIHYALIVNPHIYISCIKQFWNTASVKRPAQMGYEKPSTKLTFYKAFFSSQWKFLIHTILQSLSAKRTSWNEFSTAMAFAVICLSKGQKFNFPKYIFDSLIQVGDLSTHTTRFISPALTQKVFANIRRVGKGFLGVETPLFEGMLVVRQHAEEEVIEAQVQVNDVVAAAIEENAPEDVAHDAIPSPPPHVIPSPSQEPSSPPQQQQSSLQAPPQDADFPTQLQQVLNLKERVKKLEKANKIKSSKLRHLRKVGASRRVESSADMEDVFNQGRTINDMDMDEGIELVKDAEEVVEVVTTTKLITEVVTAAALQVSVASITILAASTTIPAASATVLAAKPTIPAAALTVVAAYTRRRKGVIIRDPEEELPLKTPAETPKVKDKGKGILVETPKPMKKKDKLRWMQNMQGSCKKRLIGIMMASIRILIGMLQWIIYQGIKKRPQTESKARKNMMIYLKNTAGYKIDFFKGMTYAQICPIFQARFDENIRFLFKSKEEMEEEDQEIIKSINETPAQKAAKRRKLSEEAQEAEDRRKLLEVVEDEDDDVFIEATPLAQKVPVVDYHIVLVDNKPRYPLSRFILEQLVNVTRLQVKEESEMSLELLTFTRQQLQENQQG